MFTLNSNRTALYRGLRGAVPKPFPYSLKLKTFECIFYGVHTGVSLCVRRSTFEGRYNRANATVRHLSLCPLPSPSCKFDMSNLDGHGVCSRVHAPLRWYKLLITVCHAMFTRWNCPADMPRRLYLINLLIKRLWQPKRWIKQCKWY